MEAVARPRTRRGTETRQRQRRLTYRITETEYAQVEAAASAAGLTLASYARARTVDAPTTRARRRASVDVLAIAKLLAAVHKAGVNLHQIARHLNFGGMPFDSELREALALHRAVCAAILAELHRAPSGGTP